MQQVSEAATLENLDLNTGKQGLIRLLRSLLLGVFESTDELAILLVDTVVKERLEMAAEGRELFDLQILTGLESLEFSSVDVAEE